MSNGVEFDCLSGQTILDAAKSSNIAIEHSCKSGRCGVCIADVVQGDSVAVVFEEFMNHHNGQSSQILTCCRSPTSDLWLDLEDLGDIGSIPILTLPCRLDSIEYLNDDVARLYLRLPPNSSFEFVAGQYIDLIKGDIRRSYSIANSPGEDGRVELHIKKVNDGAMSNYIFSDAETNDLLRFEGPMGTFSYRPDDSDYIVLMATGTGISPIKAILESFEIQPPNKKIYVFWGGRYQKDLYLNFNAEVVEYNFIPVLSRMDIAGYYFGYVQDAVLGLGLKLSKATVYACGSAKMIESAGQLLVDNGLSPKKFHSDAFVSSN